jgi:hypothetical protein
VRRGRTSHRDDGLVAPTAAEPVLESVFEADCEGAAYGDRPRRSGIDRIKEVHRPSAGDMPTVVDADLSNTWIVASYCTPCLCGSVEEDGL